MIETVEMPWGTKLIPVDELERLIADRRQPARTWIERAKQGRPRVLSHDLVEHIRAEREGEKHSVR